MPFGGSNHDWAAAEVAALLARSTGEALTVVGALRDDDDASRMVARLALALQRVIGIPVSPRLVEPVPSAVA